MHSFKFRSHAFAHQSRINFTIQFFAQNGASNNWVYLGDEKIEDLLSCTSDWGEK